MPLLLMTDTDNVSANANFGFIVPPKIEGIYLRIWIYKFVIALSTNRLLNWQKKSKIKFKFIFGIEGRR